MHNEVNLIQCTRWIQFILSLFTLRYMRAGSPWADLLCVINIALPALPMEQSAARAYICSSCRKISSSAVKWLCCKGNMSETKCNWQGVTGANNSIWVQACACWTSAIPVMSAVGGSHWEVDPLPLLATGRWALSMAHWCALWRRVALPW